MTSTVETTCDPRWVTFWKRIRAAAEELRQAEELRDAEQIKIR